VKKYLEAADTAAHEIAAFMTADLRSKAKEAGWHPKVSNSLLVKFEGGQFGVHVPDEHKQAAFDHEYGTEHTAPTGIIRKYGNDFSHVAKKYGELVKHHAKKGKE
jgi:hypothetical protein